MKIVLILAFLLGPTVANRCMDIDGTLAQIDAGNGMVFGINASGSVFSRAGNSWLLYPGNLQHVTVGPAGVWGVNKEMNIFRMVAGNWLPVGDQRLSQMDAGGETFVAGVDEFGSSLCLPTSPAFGATNQTSFQTLPGRMHYLSCSTLGCWGVTLSRDVYHRSGVSPHACLGLAWSRVFGKFNVIEVGADGQVFGISISQQLYTRKGITQNKPTGWGWTKIQIGNLRFKHVSWDLGHLWLLKDNGRVVQCTSNEIM